MTEIETAWLAGLLEGEATFGYYGDTASVQLSMTDEDIVARVNVLIKGNTRKPYQPKGKDHYKMVYGCFVSGQRAIDIMKMIYPMMSKRRQAKMDEVFVIWNSIERKPRHYKADGPHMATCHPDRLHQGKRNV